MPAEIIAILNRAGNKALQDKEQRDLMLGQGNEIAGGTPEDFAALIKAERPRWAKVVKDAKIEPE
jgi:tripartite-type tricarboxylate transporter receptor subunit TctC